MMATTEKQDVLISRNQNGRIGTTVGLTIRRRRDGEWVGDVNFHYNPDKDWWDMGIVIYAPYRGNKYAVLALELLLDHAFLVCQVSRIHNDFEIARNEVAAWKTHLSAGFREIGRENGWLEVMVTREQWLMKKKNLNG